MDGIINYLNQIDTNIFLYFNGLHNHYWDYFMTMYSDRFVWIPFYASFLYVMLRNFHIKETVTCLLVIVAIIFIFALSIAILYTSFCLVISDSFLNCESYISL